MRCAALFLGFQCQQHLLISQESAVRRRQRSNRLEHNGADVCKAHARVSCDDLYSTGNAGISARHPHLGSAGLRPRSKAKLATLLVERKTKAVLELVLAL